jgi:hypothetical protein
MLAALLLLAACPAPQATPTQPAPGPGTGTTSGTGGTPTPTPGTTEEPRGPKLGEPCGAGDTCGEGTCVSYFGIAGPRGPEFKSCEIRCDPQRACEGGRQCVTVADGPGQVCR